MILEIDSVGREIIQIISKRATLEFKIQKLILKALIFQAATIYLCIPWWSWFLYCTTLLIY